MDCPSCRITLASKQSLVRHWTYMHKRTLQELEPLLEKPRQAVESAPKQFSCPICSKGFTRKDHMKTHQQKVHGQVLQKREGRFTCPVVTCDVGSHKFMFATDLINHCEKYHAEDIGIEHHSFQCWEDFESWKEREEESTHTHYVKGLQQTQQTEPHKISKATEQAVSVKAEPTSQDVMFYYACARDGVYRENKTQRKTNKRHGSGKRPSRKIENVCISRMYVHLHACDKHVTVKYASSHTNHDLSLEQTKYLPLPQTTKNNITMKLAMKIPIERILDDIRDDVGRRENRAQFVLQAQRKHFVTRKDCLNLQRKVRHLTYMRHEDDAQSVHLFVGELQSEAYNPILGYKVQGKLDPEYPQLTQESFFLAIQTEHQSTMYAQFAPTILCIDSTHKTNSHQFKLITALVPDEYGQGQPVAWCIADREDGTIIELFLRRMSSRSPDTCVKTVMSDDDNAGWLAVQSVYGTDVRHLLCRWHVDQNWRRHIRLIHTETHQVEIYQTLQILLEETDPEIFHSHMEAFLSSWKMKEPKFIEYFEKTYAQRAEKWAMCYRNFDHGDTDTNMFVESFHNKLKYNPAYLGGHMNKRVDHTLMVLLRIEEDMFFERERKNMQWKANPRLTKEHDRHKKGVQIPMCDVKQTDTDTWTVDSQTEEKVYNIQQVAQQCTHNTCTLKCTIGKCNNVCCHMFKCDCYDFANGHLCKHIHAVQSTASSDSDVPVLREVSLTHKPTDGPTPSSYLMQLKTTNVLLETGQKSIVAENTCLNPHLKHINTLLNQVVLTIRTAESQSTNNPVHTFPVEENVHPAQKPETQLRFHSTVKKAGRKRKDTVLRHANAEEKDAILQSLQSTSTSSQHIHVSQTLERLRELTHSNNLLPRSKRLKMESSEQGATSLIPPACHTHSHVHRADLTSSDTPPVSSSALPLLQTVQERIHTLKQQLGLSA